MRSASQIIDRRKDDNFIPFEARSTFENLSAFKQVELREDVKSFYTCDIVPAAKYFIDHHSAEDLNLDGLYDEFPLFQQFVSGNLAEWSASKTSTEDRWLELFKSLNIQRRPVPNFSTLAQYALAIPGTSTEVERLFSIIKNIWGADKGQMSHKMLEAHLEIKFNSNQTCQEFFAECRSNKKLLAQVHSGEKYKEGENSE